MNRWIRRAILLAIAVVAAALVAVPVFVPAAAAYACPSCYGFVAVSPDVYIERTAGEAERTLFLESLAEAEDRVSEFYPERDTDRPVFLLCLTQSCDQRSGGKGAKAEAYGARFIRVSPQGRNTTILAHELSHVELHGRVGSEGLLPGRLPAWFDEGLAVIISRDERYVEIDAEGELSCSSSESGDLPVRGSDWGREAGEGRRPIYAMAACRTLEWLDRRGGVSAVAAVAQALRDGESFPE
jgi:hypothetical protein